MTTFGSFYGGVPVLLDDNIATLSSDLIYTARNGATYHVPAGFKFDGASIPRFLWSLFSHPFTDGYIRPSALHDWHCLYKTIDSKLAHRLFYEGLRSERIGFWRAQIMYRVTQIFGPRF